MMRQLWFCSLFVIAVSVAAPAEVAVPNPGFEAGDGTRAANWSWWSRQHRGSAERVRGERHTGQYAVHVRHEDDADWALTNSGRLAVRPGQTLEATARVRVKTGQVTLAVVALGKGKPLQWDIGSPGSNTARPTEGAAWVELLSVVEVPEGCDQVYVRLVGKGHTDLRVDDVTLARRDLSPAVRPRVQGHAKQRIRERLDRGLVAVRASSGRVHLSWRLLETDAPATAFNVYRQVSGKADKVNARPLTGTTDFLDGSAPAGQDLLYQVCPVIGTEEADRSESVRVRDAREDAGVLAIPLQGKVVAQKVAVADLDGDGRYDYVLKQPEGNIDPYEKYWSRSPDTYKLEAYRADGRFLWRYDLGWSIERGIWYSPYVVFDLDGDGKAEVAVKTGEGDPRGPDGRVQTGPEYLTILDGLTGRPLTRVDWPSRDIFQGPGAYNYASRNQLCVAYLDGKTPCLIVERGTYNAIIVAAYTFHNGQLREVWRWDNRRELRRYWGQGAHTLQAADIDHDGRDEVILGSAALDDNGTSLWSTGLGHPDAAYVGKIDPDRPGLQIYYNIETRSKRNGMCLVDAATGRLLWGHDQPTVHIHAQGLCSDLDPDQPGSECYGGERDDKAARWLWSSRGRVLAREDLGGLSPLAVHWGAVPQRQLLRGGRLTPYRGKPLPGRIQGRVVAVADVLGDWREEVISCVPGELRVHSTTIPAADRRVTLMQDPLYRLNVVSASTGYYQVPMTGYHLATGKK